MEVRVNADEFAILEWLHRKRERAAPDVQDFLSTALREQVGVDDGRYAKARDFLRHFDMVETREAEVESGDRVEAIKITPVGENFYRHADCKPDLYRFDEPRDATS